MSRVVYSEHPRSSTSSRESIEPPGRLPQLPAQVLGMSERVTRSQTGKTPRKSMLPDGFVETPSRQRRSRKPTPSSDLDRSSPTTESHATGVDPVVAIPRDEAKMNGLNGHANGAPKAPSSGKPRGIDGWVEGSDPKLDTNPLFDFGGSIGATAIMIGFPLLMYYMWIGATYYDGQVPTRASPDQPWSEFLQHLVHLVYEGAFPHLKAWAIYWVFFVVQMLFYLYMPGIYATGKPLPHENGRQLTYYCSGVYSFYTTIALTLALHYTGLFKLYTLIDEFGPLMSVAILSGILVSIIAYASALARGAQHRMTGYHVYDFFMGAELNPRMFGWVDFKMFFEVRLPWFILFLVTLGAAARQYEEHGYVSGEVGFLLMVHFLYANACCKGEELIVATWDIYYEKWGFMLIFWNMAGVPLSYCHCTIYLANHQPSTYAWSKPALVLFYTSYLFAYWVWDTCNSQKNMFRATERGQQVHRKTFPQLPWKEIKDAAYITSESGDSLLCDGWYKMARKVHYTCDLYFALTWGLITGFHSPFPWFYPVFFAAMIMHRAYRDVQRCREKYGKAWEEYTRRVPWLFIPYVI